MLYKIKTIPDGGVDMKKVKKSEAMLKDLLAVMPTLKKHKLEGEIHKKIRTLRTGRKTRNFSLELSRKFNGQEIKVSSPLTRASNKIEVLSSLKDQITSMIRQKREEARPPIETFTFAQGVSVPKLAEVYLEPLSFYKVAHRKVRLDMTGRTKAPKTTDLYVGVEIELASKKDRNFICDKLFEAGVGKYVTVKDDGSIGSGTNLRTHYPFPHEVCILAKESEIEQVVATICKVLNEQCEVKVDKTCGLHVHVDMRSRDVAKSFHNLVSMQQFLYAMLPAARRSSRYSYPVKGTTWRVLDERYHGINSQAYEKYRTLEARMHCGTTQANKINNWIKLLIAMADAPKVVAPPTTIDELQAAINIDSKLAEYVKARIAKFAAQHKASIPSAEEPGTMPNLGLIPSPSEPDQTLMEESEVA